MIPFEEIDDRLTRLGKNRTWLTEETPYSGDYIRTVLAPKSTRRTVRVQQILSDAIEREEERQRAVPTSASPAVLPDRVTIDCEPEERRNWEAAAQANRTYLDAWIVGTLNIAASLKLGLPAPASQKPPAPVLPNVSRFPSKANILATAGSPISAEVTDWDGENDTVMVRISGLSMAPLLNDGDVVPMKHKRVSRNPHMKKGLIYLVAYDGGYTVKRYNTRPATAEEKGEEWVESGKVKVLQSINPDFPEIIIKQPLEWVAWLDDRKAD